MSFARGGRCRAHCPSLRLGHSARKVATNRRYGAAVVELALLLPLLAFIFVVAVDFSRVYFFSVTLQNCARAGALYASDLHVANESPFASAEEAALADATNLNPPPTIATALGTDSEGRAYVDVSADYPYQSITKFPGIPAEINLSRSVRMYRSAIIPNTY